MATPMRQPEPVSPVAKRPNGRFWIGKSLAGSLADSTQLCSAGSWVSSRLDGVAVEVVGLLFMVRAAPG